MHRTTVFLEDHQADALDELARSAGFSRAEMLRRVLDRGLASEADARAADLAAIDRSFGCLAAVGLEPFDRREGAREKYLRESWATR